MAYQLSLDSCTKACSVALISLDGPQSAAWFEILDRGHAEILADKAHMLMQEIDIKASDISQIAVTIGPGTFTGARIALAFARMFGAARDIPLIAVNSLEAIAFNAVAKLNLTAGDIVHTAIDARRGQVYFASYDFEGRELFAPKAIDIEAAVQKLTAGSLVLGTGRDLLLAEAGGQTDRFEIGDNMHFPHSEVFGNYVKYRPAETSPPSPLYLRAADAKLPSSHPISFTQ
ncbi:MAG: tRNA (adenosine(37)-N6)-threonylcarbamoyltransferase complex dimerization subunit type 1 TsaB [Rhizobiales bacterium]|nr:tRNA (adenosine(37)-N6)-threonylcarbamoyltransferase complex dimerization subunit type 1 TsaB [Hyphomicrobiales bacterium]NRB15256.1 tRNA (adenosine(37)-N6)-threonylcarbamoyltransferase complex dimerization subunit type 1 TsaB [Hyphomicrobiales bacterium]